MLMLEPAQVPYKTLLGFTFLFCFFKIATKNAVKAVYINIIIQGYILLWMSWFRSTTIKNDYVGKCIAMYYITYLLFESACRLKYRLNARKYLVYNFVKIFVATCVLEGVISQQLLSIYMYYIELSNLPWNVWYYYKKTCKDMSDYKKNEAEFKNCVVLFYIPIRVLFCTFYTFYIIQNIFMLNGHTLLSNILSLIFVWQIMITGWKSNKLLNSR